ncbi:hypothetical protein ACO0RG_004174 [Hanseniaspora osmophila]
MSYKKEEKELPNATELNTKIAFINESKGSQKLAKNEVSTKTENEGVNEKLEEAVDQENSSFTPFDENYKPKNLLHTPIMYSYSIKEMLDLEECSLADEANMQAVKNKLPIKSFWRLKAKPNSRDKYNNNGTQSKNQHGSHFGAFGGANFFSNDSNKQKGGRNNNDDFHSDGKTRKQKNNRRRRSQAGGNTSGSFGHSGSFGQKSDADLEEELELLKLEEEMGPSGNSMHDFEAWKLKMRQLERKKKGLPPIETPEDGALPDDSFGQSQRSHDPMAGFFNMNSPQGMASEELEPKSQDANKKSNDIKHKSSSRFTSFFSEASGSPVPVVSDQVDTPPVADSAPQNSPAVVSTSQNSKMLSFFNSKNVEQTSANPNSSEGFPDQPFITSQQQLQQQPLGPPPGIAMNTRLGGPPHSSGENSFFFEKLLSKGKYENQSPNPAAMQGGATNVFPGPNNFPQPQGKNPPIHMPGTAGMAPPIFSAHQAQQPMGQPSYQQPNGNRENPAKLHGQSRPAGNVNNMPHPNMFPHMMYGMPPPPFMQGGAPPSGFPPNGFPPNNMPFPNGFPANNIPGNGLPPFFQDQMMHPK